MVVVDVVLLEEEVVLVVDDVVLEEEVVDEVLDEVVVEEVLEEVVVLVGVVLVTELCTKASHAMPQYWVTVRKLQLEDDSGVDDTEYSAVRPCVPLPDNSWISVAVCPLIVPALNPNISPLA